MSLGATLSPRQAALLWPQCRGWQRGRCLKSSILHPLTCTPKPITKLPPPRLSEGSSQLHEISHLWHNLHLPPCSCFALDFLFLVSEEGKPALLVTFCCSVTMSCPTLCDPRDCSPPHFPVLHNLLEFAQVHVNCVIEAI